MLTAKGFQNVTVERFQNLYTHPIIKMYEDVGFQFSQDYSFDDLSREWYEIYKNHPVEPSLFEDVHHCLQRMGQANVRQMIISALHHGTLMEQIRLHGIEDYFSGISGHHDLCADSKLDRAVSFVQIQGIDVSKAVVIGDTTHDAEMARKIGCRCFLVSRGYEAQKKLESTGFPVFSDIVTAVSQISETNY